MSSGGYAGRPCAELRSSGLAHVKLHSAFFPQAYSMHVADANTLSDCHCFVQILAAAKDPFRKPCLVFGEPGLEKDNIAALLHFGSADRTKPMIQVNCTAFFSNSPFSNYLFLIFNSIFNSIFHTLTTSPHIVDS